MMGRDAARMGVMKNLEEIFLTRNLRDIYHLRDLRVCKNNANKEFLKIEGIRGLS
jgi:hypothetical protein